MEWIYLAGRVLFSLLFLSYGVAHFAKRGMMVQYGRMKGAPAPEITVPLGGLMNLAGGFSVLLGFAMEVGTALLVLFVLPTAFIMHAYWKETDFMEKANQQAHFMKNVALGGAALILLWLVRVHGYGPLALGAPLGGLR
jgi:uncharacterized membrane protein YphA (DoxX/SURF4 family)